MRLRTLSSRKKLGLGALGVGLVAALALPAVLPASAAATRYEAESATLSQAAVATNHLNYSGTGFADYTNVAGSYVEWTVNAASAGTATLVFGFSNGSTADRPMDVSVNGTVVASGLAFGPTASWDAWATKTVTAAVNTGSNTIRATATAAAGGPNVDYLDFSVAPASNAYQAEDATLSQAVVATNHLNYTGSGFVDYANVTGSYVELTVTVATAGSYSLAFRSSNGSTVNRPMDISVNGTVVGNDVAFNPTGNWDTWQDVTVNATLTAGANKVRATATTANGGPNLDKLTVGTPGSTPPPPPPAPDMAVAPYEYLGWGSPPTPTDVMTATGVKWFTMAFILSDGSCNPAWDGSRPLTGGDDQTKINAIRSKGGDVVVSVGGSSGAKLGEHCSSASALAGAYQKVINAYALKAIDIDIEATEFGNATVRQRVIDALKIIKTNNPSIKTIVTMGTATNGPDSTGKDLVNRGAASGLANDVWGIMPFDFGGHTGTMGQVTATAAEGLKNTLKSAYGYSDSVAYAHLGISSMNGMTDEADETVTLADFQSILSYAQQHHVARLTFWSVNRDRQCATGLDADSCSGVSQSQYAYTKIFVQYTG